MRKPVTPLVGAALALTGSLVMAQAPVVERSEGAPAARAPAAATVAPAPLRPAQPQPNPLAELLMTLDQLQEEVRFLRGQVEEQAHAMKQMRTDQRDRYRDLDRRISLLTQRLSESQSAPVPLPPPTDDGASVESPLQAPAPRVSDEEAYRQAFAQVRERNFDGALAAFAAFERTYPQSPLLGNVYYWSGEVHRAKSPADHGQAQLAYQRLLERFPNHAKAPEATYKLGLTYAAQGDQAKAAQMMQSVVGRYPDQPPAQLARDYLSKN